jgi:glycosyltransferase involved in cell wall biosynthesis
MMTNQRILIVANVWPEPTSSAAGTRMMQLIQFFKSKNAEILFSCTAHPSDFIEDLNAMGIQSKKITINSNTFDAFLSEYQPTAVIFDRFNAEEQFGWRVMQHCPKALRILNTEDLHFLRNARQQSIKKGIDLDLQDRSSLNSERAVREISSIYRSDISLFVSETEIELLKSVFNVPAHLLYYLPLFSPVPLDNTPTFEQRKDFVFIGNFRHAPNWDSILFIKEKIWKHIRKQLPDAKINVYGAYPNPKVKNLHNEKEGFLVHGRAKDAVQVHLNARVSLAPLRFGAGIKGKLLEAMRTGTPNVTTSIGAEDMQIDHNWGGRIADNAEEIASCAVQLYSSPSLWLGAQKQGYTIVNERFNAALHLPAFSDRINSLMESLSVHRKQSYTAELMQQQTVMSSHYMSLWIMEKDKNTSNK